MLIHDATLERETTGRGPLRGISAADFTRLRLRDSEERGVTMAEAIEVLRAVRRPLKVQVDFKEVLPPEGETAAAFLDGLAPLRANSSLQVVVGGLADWNLRALRRLEPGLPVGLDFALYLDSPGAEPLRLPHRINAYGYLDDHPLGYRRYLPVHRYLEDRVEALLSLVPDAQEVYLHESFVTQAMGDGLDAVRLVHRLRPGVLVDVWTINADEAGFGSRLATALDLGAGQITTDTAVQLARHVSKREAATEAAAEPAPQRRRT